MMPPKVTVLMPVYNGLPYLRQAIESVLDQTFTDFEFLVIEDASTDESVACLKSYKDARIRLVCNAGNLGQARSLNRGLGLARGTYIARLDQDDVCLPERLQKQVTFLEERLEVAVVCSWEYSIDSHGRKIRAWRGHLKDYGAFLGTLLVGKCPIWHPSIMFRRRIVLDLGGYDAAYAPADDFDLWTRLAIARYNAAIVPEFLVLQRLHAERQSVKRGAVQLSNMQRSHDKLIGAFCDAREAKLLAQLLRMEDTFRSLCRSKRQVGHVLRALNDLLANMQVVLDLSPQESASLRRTVFRRLGPGVDLGSKIVRLPYVLFYPIFFGLSPLLIPRVRRVLSALSGRYHELRYPGRLIQSGVERLLNRI
jgi:glycosyltransferase involved in cell wall biosynthesis